MTYNANTKNDIVSELSIDLAFIKNLKKIAKLRDDDTLNDLMQELYVILLTKPDELIIQLNKKDELKYFIIKIVQVMVFGKSKQYFNKKNLLTYLDDLELKDSEGNIIKNTEQNEALAIYNDIKATEVEDDRIRIINEIINDNKNKNKRNKYTYTLFDIYVYNDKTYKELEKEIDIKAVSIWNAVTKTKQNILKLYKKYDRK